MTQTDQGIAPQTAVAVASQTWRRGLLSMLNLPKTLLGPILDKEMRIASRRQRNYILRSSYIALLMIIVAIVWYEEIGRYGDRSSPYSGGNVQLLQDYNKARVGIIVVVTVVWFQFCAAQLFSIVACSTAISEETNRRTLGVLMSTPLTAMQIVLGKLTSKTLQILMLLAISLPILAVVRVFGGIPWEYMIAGLSLTFCCSLFAAAAALFCSIFTRHAYWAIILTILLLAAVYILPVLGLVLANEMDLLSSSNCTMVVMYSHPFVPMVEMTDRIVYPWSTRAYPFAWQMCCLISLGCTALLVLLSMAMVRRAGLRQALGDHSTRKDRKLARTAAPPLPHQPPPPPSFRRVSGSPMVWKETRRGLLKGHLRWIVPLAMWVILLISYLACGRDLWDHESCAVYTVILLILPCLLTIILAPTPITSEREARSMDVLMMTNFSSAAILWGKATGILKRTWWIWVLPLAHQVLMMTLYLACPRYGYRSAFLHPIALLHLLMVCIYVLAFTVTMGLFVGTLVRNSTAAVTVSLILALVLWLGMPLALLPVDSDASEAAFAWTNPVYQIGEATYKSSQESRTRYEFGSIHTNMAGATAIIAITMACYLIAAGGLFAWAAARLRRRE